MEVYSSCHNRFAIAVQAMQLALLLSLPTIINGWITPSSSSTLSYHRNVKPSTSTITTTKTTTTKTTTTMLDGTSRRDILSTTVASLTASVLVPTTTNNNANALEELLLDGESQKYKLKFPTLFAPLYGNASRKTIKRSLGRSTTTTTTAPTSTTTTPTADGSSNNINNDANNIWALEQNLELGPLQTPLRCTVIQLNDGTLWVHAPLAPTEEFFQLVQSCASGTLGGTGDVGSNAAGGTAGGPAVVSHVVVPTYALEHKVFVKDCLERWPEAQLWTSPNQFSFPFRGVSEEFVFGKRVSGVLGDCYGGKYYSNGDNNNVIPPWSDEIEYATLYGGTFNIGGKQTTLSETAFFHKSSKTLIVTDAVARIPKSIPELNDPEKLLLISKRSTSDPMPEDTPEARLAGWKKTVLLVSYFFPEHEEPDPSNLGVVTWTDGWEENFVNLAERKLLVPPVVRTLLYAQNPMGVRRWVDIVSRESGWDFDRIVPAHFDAPIEGVGPEEFRDGFRFLEDESVDAFPLEDLRRGLRPIADFVLKRL